MLRLNLKQKTKKKGRTNVMGTNEYKCDASQRIASASQTSILVVFCVIASIVLSFSDCDDDYPILEIFNGMLMLLLLPLSRSMPAICTSCNHARSKKNNVDPI
jgi:hypothetical protein